MVTFPQQKDIFVLMIAFFISSSLLLTGCASTEVSEVADVEVVDVDAVDTEEVDTEVVEDEVAEDVAEE